MSGNSKRKLFKCTRTDLEAETMQELMELMQLEILALREELLCRITESGS